MLIYDEDIDFLLREALKDRYSFYLQIFNKLDQLEIDYGIYLLPKINDEFTDVNSIDIVNEVIYLSLRDLLDKVGLELTLPMSIGHMIMLINFIYDMVTNEESNLTNLIQDDITDFENLFNLMSYLGYQVDNEIIEHVVYVDEKFFDLLG